MIPISDENPTRNFPLITILLIGANVLIFLLELSVRTSPQVFFTTYGLIPQELIRSPITAYPTIFSSMFLHSGFLHLGGNMLYLWIFGNNVEDILGKLKFILFYLVCGTLAALGHIATDIESNTPMVGASGAVSGILGAYFLLFPYHRVKTLVFLGFFITIVRLPALVLLGIWMFLQVANSLAMPPGEAGVAWFAHIGGFLMGMLLIHPFRKLGPA
ncbi:MAG: rhomboid family intramembrane serine protease [Nitrospinaceae bacterium]|nr:rhomboid family intramembrane serine protease [Nitrospinaceae bacterium]NIR57510.1 rhomboid family intramembrane serine protease [Nitrospinaceae bacterium]NIS87980.1 rhomboid family intramembrane serine protease [Nitrospinaceae bacterium]NIT84845.1 rhomboid family intramembrane serine protease [Nitrospinaceae bacterium]NIU47025.1 rhomboid family intramembrane serine protease [Nitrospinaceae bacterium]